MIPRRNPWCAAPSLAAIAAIAAIGATLLAAPLASITPLQAQRAPIAPSVRSYVRVDTPTFALTNVRVIDGTGAAARERQTVVVRDGNIVALGATGSVAVPAGAQTIDLAGKSVMRKRLVSW